jgi:hypothetical protein
MKALCLSVLFIVLNAFSCLANPHELIAVHEEGTLNTIQNEKYSYIISPSSANQFSTITERVSISFTSPIYLKKQNKQGWDSLKMFDFVLSFKYRQCSAHIINVLISCRKSVIIFPFNCFW